jgi:hypothetical protein
VEPCKILISLVQQLLRFLRFSIVIPVLILRGYWLLVSLFSGYLVAKQLAILKILNNLKHATDRLQMPSSPQVVK